MAVISSVTSSAVPAPVPASASLFAPLGRTPRVLLFAVIVAGACPAALDAVYFVQNCNQRASTTANADVPASELAIPGGRVAYLSGDPCGEWRGPHASTSARYTSAGGTHVVRACIYRKYIELGGPIESGLGFPTSSEQTITGGRISYFQFGYIFTDGHAVYPVFKQ